MGRAWEATPKKECRYWPGRRISKTSSRIKINYIKACQLHRRKDAGRCDESVKKKEERRRNQRTRLTEDDTPFCCGGMLLGCVCSCLTWMLCDTDTVKMADERGSRGRDDEGDSRRVIAPDGGSAFRCTPCEREFDEKRPGEFDEHLITRHGVCRVKNARRMTFREGDETKHKRDFRTATEAEAEIVREKWRAKAASKRRRELRKQPAQRGRGRPSKSQSHSTESRHQGGPMTRSRSGRRQEQEPARKKSRRDGSRSSHRSPGRGRSTRARTQCRVVKAGEDRKYDLHPGWVPSVQLERLRSMGPTGRGVRRWDDAGYLRFPTLQQRLRGRARARESLLRDIGDDGAVRYRIQRRESRGRDRRPRKVLVDYKGDTKERETAGWQTGRVGQWKECRGSGWAGRRRGHQTRWSCYAITRRDGTEDVLWRPRYPGEPPCSVGRAASSGTKRTRRSNESTTDREEFHNGAGRSQTDTSASGPKAKKLASTVVRIDKLPEGVAGRDVKTSEAAMQSDDAKRKKKKTTGQGRNPHREMKGRRRMGGESQERDDSPSKDARNPSPYEGMKQPNVSLDFGTESTPEQREAELARNLLYERKRRRVRELARGCRMENLTVIPLGWHSDAGPSQTGDDESMMAANREADAVAIEEEQKKEELRRAKDARDKALGRTTSAASSAGAGQCDSMPGPGPTVAASDRRETESTADGSDATEERQSGSGRARLLGRRSQEGRNLKIEHCQSPERVLARRRIPQWRRRLRNQSRSTPSRSTGPRRDQRRSPAGRNRVPGRLWLRFDQTWACGLTNGSSNTRYRRMTWRRQLQLRKRRVTAVLTRRSRVMLGIEPRQERRPERPVHRRSRAQPWRRRPAQPEGRRRSRSRSRQRQGAIEARRCEAPRPREKGLLQLSPPRNRRAHPSPAVRLTFGRKVRTQEGRS